MATWAEMPRSPGQAFYDCLQDLLREAGFDEFVEGVCKPYYALRMGAPVASAGTVFPRAHDRLLRGHRKRAGHRAALRGLILAARRELSRDVDADGERERHRYAERRGPGERKRKCKTLSNADWKSPTDPDASIAEMKEGTTGY